jgi:hypothetical protein
MSRSRLLTELFDSRPYISATDTPGVALAPGTRGLAFAIPGRFPTERFKEDGMMLKKANSIPPNYSAPSLLKYAKNHLLLCLKEGVPRTRDSMSAAVMMMLGLEESPRPASPDFYTQRRL